MGTTQFVFDVGMVIGDVLFTWMSDRIGRKSVLLFSHAGLIVVNVIGAFANSYEVFTVTRLFCGAFEEVEIKALYEPFQNKETMHILGPFHGKEELLGRGNFTPTPNSEYRQLCLIRIFV